MTLRIRPTKTHAARPQTRLTWCGTRHSLGEEPRFATSPEETTCRTCKAQAAKIGFYRPITHDGPRIAYVTAEQIAEKNSLLARDHIQPEDRQ